jgi:hypothetical protein
VTVIKKLGGTIETVSATGWIRYLQKSAQDVVVVDVSDCDQPHEYLPHLGRLPFLHTLVVGGHECDDRMLNALAALQGLRTLVLDSTRVSNDGIEQLSTANPQLVVSRSQRRACVALERTGISLNGQDEQLTRDLQKGRLGPSSWLREGENAAHLSRSPVVLNADMRPIGDSDLKWIYNLIDVRAICLRGTRVTGSFLSEMVTPRLERVSLAATNVTDANVGLLNKWPALKVLDLSETNVSDEGLGQLGTLSSLEVCDLCDTYITDAGLRHMGRFNKLRALWLCGTKVTDQGLGHLERLTQLERLEVGDTRISASGVARLKAVLPRCLVGDGPPPARVKGR